MFTNFINALISFFVSDILARLTPSAWTAAADLINSEGLSNPVVAAAAQAEADAQAAQAGI